MENEKEKSDKKKKELTIEEKMTVALAGTPVPMATDKEILHELLQDTYKAHRRNKIINNYLTELFLKDKNNRTVIQQLAQVQAEMAGTEAYLSWLLNRI